LLIFTFSFPILVSPPRPPPPSPLFPYTTLFRSLGTTLGVTFGIWGDGPAVFLLHGRRSLVAGLRRLLLALKRGRLRALRIFGYRSEEHTSELQSRFDLVCRLLLEKKNTTHR